MRRLSFFVVLALCLLGTGAYPVEYDLMPPPYNATFSPALMTYPLNSPLKTGRITDGFGYRLDPFTREEDFHYGTDYAAAENDPIYPVLQGTVLTVGEHESYGNYLVIDHYNGFTSLYAHCKKIYVEEGDVVKKGDKIASVGDTGRTTGFHLHLELRLNGIALNAGTLLTVKEA